MKIRITRNTGIDGTRVKPGTVVEAPYLLAVDLIERDRAEPVEDDEEAEVETSDGPTFLETTDDGPSDEAEPAAPTRRNTRK